ncbi:hypothetical protein ACNKHX_15470 [Shigella flexneri]
MRAIKTFQIRIGGVDARSLEKICKKSMANLTPQALLESAMRHVMISIA